MRVPRALRAARWLLPLLAAFGALAGAEALLRAGRGAPSSEPAWRDFDYYYSDIHAPFFRILRKRGDGREVYVASRARAVHQEFLAEKPPGEIRIFVVGGSVAIDFALDDNRIREFLRKALPGRSFEVIGCGMGGYDSYRDSLVQREVLGYQPDAVVLLSGNNEYFSPEDANPAAYRLTRLLRRSRLLRAALDRWRKLRPEHEATPVERLANFESNLRLMARRAKERKVPMIFCTLPANIRDSPPVSRRPSFGKPGYLDAWAAFDAGDDRLAARGFERYVAANPTDPFGHYWLAKILDRGGLYPAAREQYLHAMDLDDPGERCSPTRNEAIRRVAREEGMIIADLENTFDAVAEHRLPDGRIFKDPMHWRQEYYPLVSETIVRAIYDAARAGGPFLSPASLWEWGWLAPEKAGILRPALSPEQRRTYDDEAVFKAMTYVIQARGELSESSVALFGIAASRDAGRLDELTASFDGIRPALGRYPWLRPFEEPIKDAWTDIAINVGEAYRRRKDYGKALARFDEALRRDPNRDLPRLLRARTLAALGREREARKELGLISTDAARRPEFAYWRARIEDGRN